MTYTGKRDVYQVCPVHCIMRVNVTYPTRTRKQLTRLIPTLEGKTHNSGQIHLNTDETTPDTTDTERESLMLHTGMTHYALKTSLSKFK